MSNIHIHYHKPQVKQKTGDISPSMGRGLIEKLKSGVRVTGSAFDKGEMQQVKTCLAYLKATINQLEGLM